MRNNSVDKVYLLRMHNQSMFLLVYFWCVCVCVRACVRAFVCVYFSVSDLFIFFLLLF